jgi:two-component system chemotaxis response regulator CheY
MIRQKILAVDDSAMMLRIIGGAIEALGYEPLRAANGKEALTVLSRHRDELALIMLDWNMPVMDGLSTLEAIRADARNAVIPIMMVTTECERQRVVEAIKAGARHYVTKPFAPQELTVRILECLGQGI